MSIRKLFLTVLAGAITAVSSSARAADLVTLTMQDRLGVARSNEPVTIGVPFPAGAVKSPTELVLKANGKPIAAEFVPIVKWPDGSIRWAHLYFAGDCPANGQAAVVVAPDKPYAGPYKLKVQDAADAITVATGQVRFVVRKSGFNVIDQASIDDKPVIMHHDRGGVVIVDGKEYRTSADKDVKVSIEESGPMHVVIKASGAHKDAAGDKKLDFICRIYAYNDSPVVRVTYTFVNAQGSRLSDFIALQGLHLDLPTTVRGGGNVTFGDEKTPRTGALKSSQSGPLEQAYVLASESDKIVFSGTRPAGESKGKSVKPRKIGWTSLDNGQIGLAAGVRWFWQTHPKSVEADANGLVRVGLFPALVNKSEKIYTGVARTHYMQFVFHVPAEAKDLPSRFAGLEDPLRPFAPPKWYCRDTKVLGNLVEADPQLYRPEYQAIVANWNDSFQAAWARFDKLMDGRQAGSDRRDDYGMLEWGDNFHYTKKAPWGKMHEWNGNYYGYPHLMAVQFVRTGHRGYFDHFDAHALHVADVHTCHYEPGGKFIGACRYCPPGDHVRFDDYTSNPPQYPVYVANTFNHFKAEEVFERWYFTGDHRMLDVLGEMRGLVLNYKGADSGGGQPRGPGHLLLTLAKFHEHTLDPAFLRRGKEVFDKIKNTRVKSGGGAPNFQQGIQLEGARRYYEVSGNPEVLDYLKRWAGIFAETKSTQVNAAQAFGLLYARTGERQYFDLALRCIRRGAGDQMPANAGAEPGGKLGFSKEKDFALTMRNGPYFLYYLSTEFPGPAK